MATSAANTGRGIEDSTIEYPGNARRGKLRVRIRCDGLTDQGRVRSNNEDNFLIARLTKALHVCRSSLSSGDGDRVSEEIAHLLAVADGLGGAAGGERASALSLATLEDFFLDFFKWFLHFEPGEKDELHRELSAALQRADAEIFRIAREERSLAGMGTTLTMAYTVRGELMIAHAGDSRAYLLHGGTLERITHDHTYAQMLVDSGAITAEQAKTNRLRNVVTNVIGGPGEGVYVEIHKLDLQDGDVLLLCTDGLTEPVAEDRIAAVLAEHQDPGEACRALLDEALQGGGPDNIAMTVARFEVARG